VGGLRLISNPCAGHGAATARCAELLRRDGAEVEIRTTEGPGHATDLAASAGDRLVVAAGGDGTVNEVINGLPEGATLGIIPLGTGNSLARELGLPLEPEAAFERVITGEVRRVDLGVATNAVGEDRRFACMAGVGFDAHALALIESRPALKRRLGVLAYPVVGWSVYLRRGLPHIDLSFHGRTLRARYAAVFNTRTFWGSHSLARSASCCDGDLDLCTVGEAGIVSCLSITVRFFADLPLNGLVPSHEVREVVAESESQVHVHLDGEVWGELPMRFGIKAGALRVVC
jgi:diacylglycerol kinase (ATP)